MSPRAGTRAGTFWFYIEDFCVFVGIIKVVLCCIVDRTVKSEGELGHDNILE